MDPEFWHERWGANRIAFHEGKANRMLVAHCDVLGLAEGARIFLPLCGKTRDIAWLRENGMRVAGAELSELAVRQLFEEMGITPHVSAEGELKHYASDGLDIYAGDIFELTADILGPVDAVFDRAALVALPENMRARYAQHVSEMSGGAQQLLITFEYDQSVMDGPPFALTDEEVQSYYRQRYDLTLLEGKDVEGRLKGIAEAVEKAWHLQA